MGEVYQRLSKIFNRLCRGEELKIGELAKEYNLSTKTIQRDLKERLAGKSLIREGNRFFLNLAKSSPKDFVLEVLQNMAKEIGGEFEREAYRILGTCNTQTKLGYPMQDLSSKFSEIASIQKAIAQRKVLQMRYYSQKLKEIKPLSLVCCGGMWYLCIQEERGREYLLLSEIEGCKVGRKSFVPNSLSHQVQISLFVYPEVAQEIRSFEWGVGQKIIKDSDGSLIIDFYCNDFVEVEREILKWIPYVVVLEPQGLKDNIEKKISSYAKCCGIT